jgi:hypothetical protein
MFINSFVVSGNDFTLACLYHVRIFVCPHSGNSLLLTVNLKVYHTLV